MSCATDKILNPKTGRCVLKTGKIGQELIEKEAKKVKVSSRDTQKENKCTKDKIINPKTGKCVLKTGKIGMSILKDIKSSSKVRRSPTPKKVTRSPTPKKVTRSPTPKKITRSPTPKKVTKSPTPKKVVDIGPIGTFVSSLKPIKVSETIEIQPIGNVGVSSKFKKIAEDCSQIKEWEKKNILGKGAYGESYKACKGDKCEYVLKTQKADKSFLIEVQALEELQETKDVPKLYAAWSCDGIGYIVMEELYKSTCPSKEEIHKQLKRSLEKFREKYGWLHVDTHNENYMCTKEGKAVLIDFGWGAKLPADSDTGYNTLYPDHPVSEKLGKPATWDLLVSVQRYNFEKNFGTEDDIEQALLMLNITMQRWLKSQ
jgi:predicted Ser/Thr protein kinase